MMVSPEEYAEIFLKGKTVSEIEKQIRIIKKELSHCKKVIERPYEYHEEMCICPSPDTRFLMNELYLEEAKKALAKAGGEYVPTKAELKQLELKNKLKDIKKFTFSIGGFFQGDKNYIVEIKGDTIKYFIGRPFEASTESIADFTKKDFLDMIEDIKIEKWQNCYHAPVLDGEQWKVEIEFSNSNRKLKYYGSNAYPFRFDVLRDFFDTRV